MDLFKTTKQHITNRIKKYYLFITQFVSTYKQYVSYYTFVLLGLASSAINEGLLFVTSKIIIRDKDNITIMEKHLNVSLINVENGEPIKLTIFLITTSCKKHDPTTGIPTSMELSEIKYRATIEKVFSDPTSPFTSWENRIKMFLSQEKHNVCRTPIHYEHNINLCREAIYLLTTFEKDLYIQNEAIWYELIRRTGLTTNVDASATKKEVFQGLKKIAFSENLKLYRLYVEDQGSKIVAKAYTIMNENPIMFFDPSSEQLILSEKNELFLEITDGNFTVGYIYRPENEIKEFLYLSGDDLHYFIALPFKQKYILFDTITSNNDGNTYKFGDKQYANKNIQEKDKAEYCRPLTYLTYIDENTLFVPSEKHSVLINKSFYNNTKIKDIFINAIKENAIEWKNNPIRKPISFTMNRLNNLAIIFCENNLNSWENTNNNLKHKLNWDKLNETEKQDEILRRSKQEQTVLVEKRKSAYRKLLPEDIKPFFDTKEKLLLEKNKLNKDGNKFSK